MVRHILPIVSIAAGCLAVLAWSYGGSSSEPAASSAPDFALLDQDGRQHELYRYRSARAVVLISHDPQCASAPRDLAAVRRLQDDHRDPGVVFLMLDPAAGTAESGTAANGGPAVLQDDAQLVAESMRIRHTGEALLLDPKTWRIVYRGPVAATGALPLAAALDAFLAGKPVAAVTAPVDGCAIARGGDGRKSAEISYATDIAPLLQQKCVACHRAGGIGPWRMGSHATIAEWSPRIRKALLRGSMPPWDADPHYGKFVNDISLSPEQKRLLLRWIDAGAPGSSGDDPLAAAPPPAAEFWPMGKPDLVVDLPVQQIPATGLLAYRNIEVQVPGASGRWLRAVDIKPTNPAVTHHITAWFHDPGTPFDQSFTEEKGLATYQPGHQFTPLPADSGIYFPEGASLVFNLHYTTDGKEETDAPKLALYFRDTIPPREYRGVGAHTEDFVIAPGERDHEVTARYVLKQTVTLHALMPHMHLRGGRFRFTAQFPDGHREVLLSVPQYRFNWQTEYTLADPLVLPAGTTIIADGSFDNSADNPRNPDPTREVKWGTQSNDEMFIGIFFFTQQPRSVESPADAATAAAKLDGGGAAVAR